MLRSSLVSLILFASLAAAQNLRCGHLNQDPKSTDHHDNDALPGQFPFVIGLKDRDDPEFSCMGTLILNRFVITASHCVVREDYLEAYLGVFDLDNKMEERKELFIRKVHFRKDLAILELKEDVKEAESMCILHPGRMVPENSTCFSAGWQMDMGSTWHSTLKYLEVDVPIDQLNNSRKLLSKNVRKTKTCLADYGSPLFCGKDGKYGLAGVVTRVTPDCATKPTIFTNTFFYGAWIHGEYISSEKFRNKGKLSLTRIKRDAAARKAARKKALAAKRKRLAAKRKALAAKKRAQAKKQRGGRTTRRPRKNNKKKPRTNPKRKRTPNKNSRARNANPNKKKGVTPWPNWKTTWKFEPGQFKCYPKKKLKSARKEKEEEGGYLRVDCDSKGIFEEDDENFYDSRRCTQYTTKANKKLIKQGKIELGCVRDVEDEQEQECILDDPLCNHDFCDNPDGWCYKMWDWNDGPSWQFEEIGDLDLPLNFG